MGTVFVLLICFLFSKLSFDILWSNLLLYDQSIQPTSSILNNIRMKQTNRLTEQISEGLLHTLPSILPTASFDPNISSSNMLPPSNHISSNGTSLTSINSTSIPRPMLLVSIEETAYRELHNWNFSFPDYEAKIINILKSLNTSTLKYNIDASFTHSRYFVIPNVKGLCNRLQLFAGLYILSSYFHIPIILSSSMEWSRYWNLRESFPGQLIELPDRGMFCSFLNN